MERNKNEVNEMTKKITMATVKSFVRKNASKEIFVNVKSSFDGMTDMCEERNHGFVVASKDDRCVENTLGLCGVWLVGRSRDWFTAYEDDKFTGITYHNSCGNGIIAIAK
jgi:hypothetical protein